MAEERTVPLTFFLSNWLEKESERRSVAHRTLLMQVFEDLFSQKADDRLQM